MSENKQNLNDENFIQFCYEQLLRRQPSSEAKQHHLKQLESGIINREEMLLQFINSKEYQTRAAALEFVPPGHFYSAIPSTEDRKVATEAMKLIVEDIPGIELNRDEQFNLLTVFKQYYAQCPFPEHKMDGLRYYFDNPAYSYTDALSLYSMMCHFKPKKMIEVGSGFSSCAMLDTNDHVFDSKIDFTFIEPYPELLESLLNKNDQKQTILGHKIQDVDKAIFGTLESDDILFIDSTHVSKLNSDVNALFFDILPNLQTGVLVHIHDIFWPFEYPKSWIQEGRAWNEAYLLRAFLQFNQDFEILFFASYLHSFHHQWFAENMPLYLKNPGGNIWLRKISNDDD